MAQQEQSAGINGDKDVIEQVENAIESPTVQRFARVGWLAKGVLWTIIGVLAIRLALGEVGEEASESGALELVARQAGGRWMLFVLGFALILYVLWRLATAFLPGSTDLEGLAKRGGYLFSALAYCFITWTALTLAMSGRTEEEGSSVSRLSESLMTTTWGRALIGIVGVIALVSGAYFVYKGMDRRFEEQLYMARWSSPYSDLVEWTGIVGWIGRSIVIFLVGIFFSAAAISGSSENAKGLDGILSEVARNTTWGTIVVAAAGVGMLVYGIFLLLSWRGRVLRAP